MVLSYHVCIGRAAEVFEARSVGLHNGSSDFNALQFRLPLGHLFMYKFQGRHGNGSFSYCFRKLIVQKIVQFFSIAPLATFNAENTEKNRLFSKITTKIKEKVKIISHKFFLLLHILLQFMQKYGIFCGNV